MLLNLSSIVISLGVLFLQSCNAPGDHKLRNKESSSGLNEAPQEPLIPGLSSQTQNNPYDPQGNDPGASQNMHYSQLIRGCFPNGRGPADTDNPTGKTYRPLIQSPRPYFDGYYDGSMGALKSSIIPSDHYANASHVNLWFKEKDNFDEGYLGLPVLDRAENITIILVTAGSEEQSSSGEFLKFNLDRVSGAQALAIISQLKKGKKLSYSLPHKSPGLSYGFICSNGSFCEKSIMEFIMNRVKELKPVPQTIKRKDDIPGVSQAIAELLGNAWIDSSGRLPNVKDHRALQVLRMTGDRRYISPTIKQADLDQAGQVFIPGMYGFFVGSSDPDHNFQQPLSKTIQYAHYSSFRQKVDVLMGTDTKAPYCDVKYKSAD